MSNKGIVNIHGKQYKTVILRVNEFRTEPSFQGFGIETKILDYGFQTGFVAVQAFITDPTGRVIGSGLAEEKRGAGNINKFSALENCETSAIGRALSSIGLGGEEYCSADELVLALDKQKNPQGNSQKNPPQDPAVIPPPEGIKQKFKRAFDAFVRKHGIKKTMETVQCKDIKEIALIEDLRLQQIADELTLKLHKT